MKNISDGPLRGVEVVASWYDKNGNFITSDSAVIEYSPIMPGQKSPFKTISRANPLMQRYTVSFKQLFGGELQWRDDRQSK